MIDVPINWHVVAHLVACYVIAVLARRITWLNKRLSVEDTQTPEEPDDVPQWVRELHPGRRPPPRRKNIRVER